METKDYQVKYTYYNDFLAMVRYLTITRHSFFVRYTCDTSHTIVLYKTTIDEIQKLADGAKMCGAEDSPIAIED
jgi:hypothetical protein